MSVITINNAETIRRAQELAARVGDKRPTRTIERLIDEAFVRFSQGTKSQTQDTAA